MINATNANIHDIAGDANDKIDAAITGRTGKKITWWGFTWRAVSLVILFVAAIVAVTFGMHFAISYIAAAGLNATLATCLQYIVAIAAYLACGFAALKLNEKIASFYADFAATRAEAKAKKS